LSGIAWECAEVTIARRLKSKISRFMEKLWTIAPTFGKAFLRQRKFAPPDTR
jgi:hypothetical protein